MHIINAGTHTVANYDKKKRLILIQSVKADIIKTPDKRSLSTLKHTCRMFDVIFWLEFNLKFS